MTSDRFFSTVPISMNRMTLGAICLISFYFIGNSTSFGKETRELSIYETIKSSKIMTKFALLVEKSGQGPFLQSRGPFTVFVPVDSAFSAMSPAALQDLTQPDNVPQLQRVVLLHVINGKRLSGIELIKMDLLTTEGDSLTLKRNKLGFVMVQNGKVLRSDIRCRNGVIHQLDTLLQPPGPALPRVIAPTPAPETTPVPPSDTTGVPTPTPLPSPSP